MAALAAALQPPRPTLRLGARLAAARRRRRQLSSSTGQGRMTTLVQPAALPSNRR